MAEYAQNCPKLPWMINFFSTEQGHVPNQQLQAVFKENRTDYLTKLNFASTPASKRLTRIMCTLGPKCSKLEELEDMIVAGMNVARIKMPFFTKTECENAVLNVRAACDSYSRKIGTMYPIAIAMDLKGPEIRTGTLKEPNSKIEFDVGDETCITSDPSFEEQVTKDVIYVDYNGINNIIEPGDKLNIDNSIRLSALEVVGSFIRCIIEKAGSIGDRAAVQFEEVLLDLPSVTDNEVQFAIDVGVDIVIVSNVRDKYVIRELRRAMGEEGRHIQILAKIEEVAAVKNVRDIIEEADGVFLSRSDLEYAARPEKLFIMQKQIIAECNKKGKPVVVAPQMLESMHQSPNPTKAEMMDITNAILDGADCLLLSRETASGDYGLKAIDTLSALCKEAESAIHHRQVYLDLCRENPWPFEPIYALAMSVVEMSVKCNAACIIMLTTSGRCAQVVARYRPRCPIIAITRYAFVARKLQLYRAVEPIHFVAKPLLEWEKDVQRRIQFGITYGKHFNFIRAGDTIVVVNGSRAGSGFTNSMSVYYASEFDAIECADQGEQKNEEHAKK